MHATIADYLLELVTNSIEARASRVWVRVIEDEQWLSLEVKDNGLGFKNIQKDEMTNPFYSSKNGFIERKTGLGLSFLKMHIDMVGGTLVLKNAFAGGARIVMRFNKSHFDCPPTGSLGRSFLFVATNQKLTDVKMSQVKNKFSFQYSKKGLEDLFGDLQNPVSFKKSTEHIEKMEEDNGSFKFGRAQIAS